jgi:hypothetical protein
MDNGQNCDSCISWRLVISIQVFYYDGPFNRLQPQSWSTYLSRYILPLISELKQVEYPVSWFFYFLEYWSMGMRPMRGIFLQVLWRNCRLTLPSLLSSSAHLPHPTKMRFKNEGIAFCGLYCRCSHTSKAPFHTFNYLLHGVESSVFKGWYFVSWSRNSSLLWNRKIHCHVCRTELTSTKVASPPLRELNYPHLQDKLFG